MNQLQIIADRSAINLRDDIPLAQAGLLGGRGICQAANPRPRAATLPQLDGECRRLNAEQAVVRHATRLQRFQRTAKDIMDQQQKLYESRQGLYKEGAISQKEVNDAQVAFTQARNNHELAQKHLEGVQSVSRTESVKSAAAQRSRNFSSGMPSER